MKRALAVLLGVGLAGAASFLWCGGKPPPSVETAVAARQPLTVEVATNGKIEPIEKEAIRARFAGRVIELPEPGTRMAKGDVLLRVDGAGVASELASARSETLAAQEALRQARAQARRVRTRAGTDRTLFEQGALTKQRLDESEAELRDAEARLRHLEAETPLRVEALELQIEELSARQEASEVRAPFDGTVYRTAVKAGETVAAGAPILWFADLERLRVRANVDQVDLGRVRVGQPVRISSNAHRGRVWPAEMAELIPNVTRKESRLVAEGLANVAPPAEGLVPGMTVDVDIVVEQVPDALQVPSEAIFTNDRGSFVYRLDDGQARMVPVRVGRSTVNAVEIVQGLSATDRVVLGPVDGIEDGARVEVIQRGVEAGG